MFRIKAYSPLLALSITALCIGVIMFYSNSSNWMTVIAGLMLWFAGCVMMIAWFAMAALRDVEEKTENQAPPKPAPLKKAS
jgi:putative Mn2+ efflux pump MntP